MELNAGESPKTSKMDEKTIEKKTPMDTLSKDFTTALEPQPQRRLSKCYHGKAKSFTNLSEAKCVSDLEKNEPEINRKRSTYIKLKELNKRIKLKTSAKLLFEDECDDQDAELFQFSLNKKKVSFDDNESK